MKKRRTLRFLVSLLLAVPLVQVGVALAGGEGFLRWTVVILSVLFYLLLIANYVCWYHLNRKMDVYFDRLMRTARLPIEASSLPRNAQAADRATPVKEEEGNDELRENFRTTYPAFLARLHVLCPALTETDEFLCMLIKLRQSNKEVIRRLSISQGSLHTARYRLKRKLAIPREENLDDWIQRLEEGMERAK